MFAGGHKRYNGRNMKWIARSLEYLYKQKKTTLWVIVILLMLIIGVIDYLTGIDISFSFFYILPVAMATWALGKISGRWIAFICAVIWQGSNILAGEQFNTPLIFLWNAATRLGFFLIVSETIDLFIRLNTELQVSRTDFLTGILNRRAFFESASRELKRLERNGEPLTIVYMDLDNFKAINDTFGHHTGDEVLKEISKVLNSHLRGADIAARLGGDEFALLLPATNKKAAQRVIQRIKNDVLKETRKIKRPMTLSTGVLTCTIAPPSTENLLQLVDHLMYDSKKKKKNAIRVAVYSG
jgi:diguanylate cyclase (GGDEF)-like protein